MDDDVIADLGLGHVGEAGLFDDAAEIDLAHARQRIVAGDAFNFSWDRETHKIKGMRDA